MEDLLIKYGIFLGKRYSLKQRQRFLLALTEEFSNLGYKTKFANDNKKRNARSVNLFIGDIAAADVIICSHHDTPAKILWPNFRYYPLNGKRTFRNLTLLTFLPTLVVTMLGALLVFYLINNKEFGGSWNNILLVASFLVSFILASLLTSGVSNKYNVNRNTASILAMIEIAKNLNQKAKRKIAFILLDKGCSNHNGVQMLQQALPTTLNKKLFIYLDCIGEGNNLALAYRGPLKKECQKFVSNFTGSQTPKIIELNEGEIVYTPYYFWKKAIAITSGNFDNKNDLYVTKINSAKDRFADFDTIEAVASMLTKSYNSNK